MHLKGYAAPEPKAAFDQARLFIERAEVLGEPPDDPFLLLSVLWGFWSASYVAFNGDVIRDLATQVMALAEKQGLTVSLMIAHRLMGMSALHTGDIAEGRAHLERAVTLYDPDTHRELATRFGQDVRVAALAFRSLALWLLGYPEAALADVAEALKDAREIGHAPSLMYALTRAAAVQRFCGNDAAEKLVVDELVALTDEKGAGFWKAYATIDQGLVLTRGGKALDAVKKIASGIMAYRSMGSSLHMPEYWSSLARAYAEIGQFDDALRYIGDAMVEGAKQKWFEAEVNRVAGEIVLKSPQPNAADAEAYFERALAVARQQQAKSWELRAAMSMARLWRDQGKRDEARELLVPVYGWFTEGFDTRDLKEAKALLDELAS
jgi:predicted ATPase